MKWWIATIIIAVISYSVFAYIIFDKEYVSIWHTQESTDFLYDTPTVAIVRFALGDTDIFGNARYLAIRCSNGELESYINWQEDIGRHEQTIIARMGKQKPHQLAARHSADAKSTFILYDQKSALGRRLLSYANSLDTILRVRAHDYHGTPYDVQFDLSGMSEAIEPIREACNF